MNEWMNELWKKGRRGRRTHRMERWQAEIRLYKTHLSLTTMEKVKAHDRYKHICYWVLQLLYFDSLVSTHVGSFDWIPLRYPVWILFISFLLLLFYSTVIWLFILQMYSAHPQKPKPSSLTSCKLVLSVALRRAVRNCLVGLRWGGGFSIVQWKHTLLTTHKGCWVL